MTSVGICIYMRMFVSAYVCVNMSMFVFRIDTCLHYSYIYLRCGNQYAYVGMYTHAYGLYVHTYATIVYTFLYRSTAHAFTHSHISLYVYIYFWLRIDTYVTIMAIREVEGDNLRAKAEVSCGFKLLHHTYMCICVCGTYENVRMHLYSTCARVCVRPCVCACVRV